MPTLTTNQGIIIPVPGDLNDVPGDMSDMLSGGGVPQQGLENRLVQRFQSIIDRTARNPTPLEGELSYLVDLNRYDTYTGSAWVPLIAPATFLYVATNYSGMASTSYTTAPAAVVGATFVVPQSGQVRVDWSGLLDNTLTTATSYLSPQLNTGAVIAGGAPITASADAISISNYGQSATNYGAFYIYSGLTPGTDVNAFLQHRVDAGAGAYSNRKIALSQA